jgi:ADP-ribose pyrophosphatase
MTEHFRDASFPPKGAWDSRLSEIACSGLSPVETVHENPWFSVRNRGGFFTMEYHRPQVAVLCVVGGESVVLVRVKRPVIDDSPLEMPAGAVEVNEEPVSAAARELFEESGISIPDPERYTPMPPIAISVTRLPRLAYVFRVDISEPEFLKRGSHDEEIHSVERIAIGSLPPMMRNGQIYAAATLGILGVFLSTFCNPQI